MKKLKNNKKNKWSTPRVHSLIKRDFKSKFNKKITTLEINKIWGSYIEEGLISGLKKDGVYKLGGKIKVWVKATPISKHKRAMSLLNKGLMYVGGRVTEAKLNFESSEYIYKIVFESSGFKSKFKLFFKPHQNISNAVRDSIKKGKLITRLQCQ